MLQQPYVHTGQVNMYIVYVTTNKKHCQRPIKSYDKIKFLSDFPIVITM